MPVSVSLNAQTTSAMISLTNHTQEPVRFHLSASEWKQKPDGQMVLNPTKEVVFFPAMLTLAPGEARNLRVGTTIKPGEVEKSYRILVAQLPRLKTSKNDGLGAVGLVTSMSIPLFLEPVKSKPALQVSPISLEGNRVSFMLKSAGNVHVMPTSLSLIAKPAKGPEHVEAIDPWYVLAGDVRKYVVSLPVSACLSAKSLEVLVTPRRDQKPLRVSLDNVQCRP